jgi:hypothetical protein
MSTQKSTTRSTNLAIVKPQQKSKTPRAKKSAASRRPRRPQPEKFTIAEALSGATSYPKRRPGESRANFHYRAERFDTIRLIRAVALILELRSDHGEKEIDRFEALGLCSILESAAAKLDEGLPGNVAQYIDEAKEAAVDGTARGNGGLRRSRAAADEAHNG